MSDLDTLFELLKEGKMEINNFIKVERTKRKYKTNKEKRYIEIRKTEYDTLHIFCEKFKRKTVSIIVKIKYDNNGNIDVKATLEEALKETWGHANQLIRNHLIPKSHKIEKDLTYSNFSLIRLY